MVSGMKGGDMGESGHRVNQESLDAAAQLMELKMKGVVGGDTGGSRKEEVGGVYYPRDLESRGRRGSRMLENAARGVVSMNDNGQRRALMERNAHNDIGNGDNNMERGRVTSMEGRGRHEKDASVNDLHISLEDEIDRIKQSAGLTELSEYQKQAILSQTLMMGSPKGQHQLNSFFNNTQQQHAMMSHSGHNNMATSPGASSLTMTGLVRTNSRVSLIDFTAEDIMRHLLSRDDIKSCDFCCMVFKDPAMYYLHKSMHDKMDVRCCNLCGKLAKDKYDFNAHYLNKHA